MFQQALYVSLNTVSILYSIRNDDTSYLVLCKISQMKFRTPHKIPQYFYASQTSVFLSGISHNHLEYVHGEVTHIWLTSLLAAFVDRLIFFTATGFCFTFQNALYTQPCPPSPITSFSFRSKSPAAISTKHSVFINLQHY